MHKEIINTVGQKILTARFLNQNYKSGGVNVYFSCHPLSNVHLFTFDNDHILTKNLPRAGKTQNTVSFGAQTLDVPKMRKLCEKDKCFSFHVNNLFNGVLSSGQGPVQPHRREAKTRTNLKRSLWKCVDDCFSLRKRVY